MNKDKLGFVLITFIFVMTGLFAYVVYTKLAPPKNNYEKETELKTISEEDELTKRALNFISFSYPHTTTDLEKKLFSKSEIKIKDLSTEDKLLLSINDIGYTSPLPEQCSDKSLIVTQNVLKNNIIKDDFLKELNTKKVYNLGPYEIYYNNSIVIKNKSCELSNEYGLVKLLEAKKSNKRLVLTVKYVYVEQIDDETGKHLLAYRDPNKINPTIDNYVDNETILDYFDTYEVTFNIVDKNIYCNSINIVK